jgi:hypothetical protein
MAAADESGAAETQVPEDGSGRTGRSKRSVLIRRLVILAFALAVAWGIIDAVGRIDWGEVWDGISHLELWQGLVLVVLLLLRQVLNARPLSLFIDGLSLLQATKVDQGATLMSMVGPTTSDSVLRFSVMRSWGIDIGAAVAGSSMNVAAFYIARWLAPAVGFLLLLAWRFDGTYGLVAAVCLPVAVAIFTGAFLVTRTRALAERTGRKAGRVAQRLRGSIDPEGWARGAADFQGHLAGRFQGGMAQAMPTLLAKFTVDALILLLAIRFVGVAPSALPAVEVFAAFFVAFPLTLFPLQGIGILDATLVASLTAVGGVELEADLVASLICYRVVTLGTPAALGAVFLLTWRTSRSP